MGSPVLAPTARERTELGVRRRGRGARRGREEVVGQGKEV